MIIHGFLKKIHAFHTLQLTGGGQQHDKCGAAADDQGIDKDAQGLKEAGLHRMADVGGSGGAGGGTASCFIGKQAPLGAVHDDCSDSSADCLAQTKGLLKDSGEDLGQHSCISYDNIQRNNEIEGRHHRDHKIQHLYRSMLAQDNDCSQSHQRHSGVKRRDVKGVPEGGGNGISDDLTDAAPADEAGEGKQGRDGRALSRTLLSGKQLMEIVGRAAPVSPIERVFFLIQLGQGSLDKGGGGT